MRDTIGGQSAAIKFPYVLIQSRRAIHKSIATLLLTLGSSSGLWFVLAADIPHAIAQTRSYDINIDRLPNETYESLVKRAETAARAAVANNLARSGKATDVSITVVAHNRGAIAPVLNLKVSSNQQSNSNSGREITYFNQARSLLRLEEDVATTTPPNSGGQNNTNRSSRYQPRNRNSPPPRTLSNPNINPGNARQGFGSNSTFSQPGRVVTPTTSGQPTNTLPPSQTNTTNPGTSPTGTGATSTSPSSTQPSSTLPSGTGLTPTSPSNPLNSNQGQSTSPSFGLTPQPSVNPSTVPSGQPLLTPSSPTSTNSNNGTSTGGNTSPSNSNPTASQGISPSTSSNGTSTGGNRSYTNSTTTTTPGISPSTP